MTDEEELAALNAKVPRSSQNSDEAELAALNSSVAQPQQSSDEAELAALNAGTNAKPERSWWQAYQDNVAAPLAGVAGSAFGSLSNLGMADVREEALLQMYKDGNISAEELASARRGESKTAPGAGQKMATAANMFLGNAFDNLRVSEGDDRRVLQKETNPQILADSLAMDKAGYSLPAINVAAMVKGQKFLWDDNNAGMLERWGSYATAGEQTVARGALSALASIGAIPKKDAIELMSQTQVHSSDLLDHYWIPDTPLSKIGRGLSGFVLDVALDPVTYMGLPFAAKAMGAGENGVVKIGNRVIADTSLLARAERQALLARNDVMKIIKSDGNIQHLEASQEAMGVLNDAVNAKGMAGLDGEIVSKFMDIDPQLGQQVAEAIRARQAQKGVIRSLADGERHLGFAFRLPLTNTLIEHEIPLFGTGTRWGAQAAIGVKDYAFDSAARVSAAAQTIPKAGPYIGDAIRAADGFADTVVGGLKQFKTFTTRPLWDSASSGFIHQKNMNRSWASRQMSEATKEVGADAETNQLMTTWLEQHPTLSDEELISRFSPYDPENSKYVGSGGQDWRVYRPDKSKASDDFLIKEYETSQAYQAQARAYDKPIKGLFPLNDTMPELSRHEKLALAKKADFATPVTRGSPGKSVKEIADFPDSGSYATVKEFTPIKPTNDLLEQVRVTQDLRKTREMADETMRLLKLKNPKAAERVQKIRQQFVQRIRAMDERNIPFQVLNPFDKTIPVEERAMGYFPHIMNPDYLDDAGNPIYKQVTDIFADHKAELGISDKTQAGRSDRRNLRTIIDSLRDAEKINDPLFVTDPLSASYARMNAMDDILAQHKVFEEIFPMAIIKRPGGKLGAMTKVLLEDHPAYRKLNATYVEEVPPTGYVKLNWKDYEAPVIKSSGGPAANEFTLKGKDISLDLTGKEVLSAKSFLPEQYKIARANNAEVYFPEDVATRLQYTMQRPKSGTGNTALDMYNYWFRNGALYGTGYQGQNFFSNLTTYMTARGDFKEMGKGTKFLWDSKNNSSKIRGQIYSFNGGRNQIEGERLYEQMVQGGVLGNSTVSEADIVNDVYENMATTLSRRDRRRIKSMNFVDHVTTYKYSRFLAEQADNMFRSGLYFDSLEKGYTHAGAVERVNLYYYDFKDVPKGQKAVSNVIPFTTFALKTTESVAQRAMNLDLKAVQFPYLVNEVMSGAFVDSYEDRQFLNSSMPFYAQDRIMGPPVPGAHQMVLEAPFVLPAIKAFMNPQDNLHPLIQAGSLVAAALGQGDAPQDPDFEANEINSKLFKSKWDEVYGNVLKSLIPPTIRLPMTLNDMRNPDEIKMLPFMDMAKQYKAPKLASLGESSDFTKALLTTNAQAFGKYARENISPDWFYNAMMFGKLSDPGVDDRHLADKDAMFGGYARAHMRDLSFGIVRFQPMDRLIVSRMAALQRQIAKTQAGFTSVSIDANILRDPLATDKLKIDLKANKDQITKDLQGDLFELNKRKAALLTYYGFYIREQKSKSGVWDSLRNALSPQPSLFDNIPPQKLTTRDAAVQNSLIRKAPDLEVQRVKKLRLQMLDRPPEETQ